MHRQYFNTQAPKKAAKEQGLIELLRDALGQEWQQQNKAAIQHYNRRIQKNGAFSDGLRRF